jgi:hypothetical protein
MPKPRKKPQSVLSISPWFSKTDRKRESPDKEASQQQTDYIVLEQDMVSVQNLVRDPESTLLQNAAPTSFRRQPSPSTAVSSHIAAPPWRSKKRNASLGNCNEAINSEEQLREAVNDSPQPIVQMGMNVLPCEPQNAALQASQAFHGTATLAWLPEQAIVLGHLIVHGDTNTGTHRSHTFPLHGTMQTSYRECTREPEWSLLRLTLTLDVARGIEVNVLAESTGGDAMVLCAPVNWQGDEALLAADLLQGCDATAVLRFDCHELLCDAAAQEVVKYAIPALVGESNVVVNIGPMQVSGAILSESKTIV